MHDYTLWFIHHIVALYGRLQKVGASMSHKSTRRYIDALVSNYNEAFRKWCREIGDAI